MKESQNQKNEKPLTYRHDGEKGIICTMEKLNKAQAAALFEANAFLFGSIDAVPEETVIDLFGEDAAEHVKSQGMGRLINGYGVGDYTATYYTFEGFMRAATYHNIKKLMESSRGKHEKHE